MNRKETHYALARARATHEMQLQQPLRLEDDGCALGVAFPVEFLNEASWKKLQPLSPQLLLSSARAKVIGLKPLHGVSVIDASTLSLQQINEWAAGNPKSLPTTTPLASPIFGKELVSMAKQAGIIPALIWVPEAEYFPDAVALEVAALRFVPPVELIRGETVSLPVEGDEHATLTSFRTKYDAAVHLVLTLGDVKTKTPPLVRVHSSCVTGDILGSLRCDCGNQLQAALAQMKKASSGILLYLHQEGRGIGISSKLRAYALQEQGLDTFAANQQLGFEEDERDFSLAAHILQMLGHSKIRLLTNNPDKIESFTATDITVSERLPLIADANAHNHAYITAKGTKAGHLF